MALLEATTTNIMNTFQNAYLDQIGHKMTIGSEEYTLASIFAYVLAVYAGMVNASYNNRFINTASGIFLDNIAKQYNLTRRPEALTPAYFEGTFILNDADNLQYNKGEYGFIIFGHEFYNELPFVNNGLPLVNRWVCDDNIDTPYTQSELIENLYGPEKPFKADLVNVSSLQGVSPEMSDEAFRGYLNANKRLFASGLAESFESAAKLSQYSVLDAHVVRQSEPGFIPGDVKLCCKIKDDFVALFDTIIKPSILEVISKYNLATIGQNVVVERAKYLEMVLQIGTLYVSNSYSNSAINTMLPLKVSAVIRHLNNTLPMNATVYATDIIEALKKPLPAITNSAREDFDLSDSEYNSIKDFVILGAAGVSSQAVKPTSTKYIKLITPIYTWQGI